MFCYISLITWHSVSWFVSRRKQSTLFTEEGLEKTNYVHKAILKRLLTTCDIGFESRDSLGLCSVCWRGLLYKIINIITW